MHDHLKLSLEEWIAVLSISSRYDMENVRRKAIAQINSHRPRVDPVEKILLAEKHDIPFWRSSAYASLCQRESPLEEWEAEKLGLKVTVQLARAREAVRKLPKLTKSDGWGDWGSWGYPLDHDVADYEPYASLEVSRIVHTIFFPSAASRASSEHESEET